MAAAARPDLSPSVMHILLQGSDRYPLMHVSGIGSWPGGIRAEISLGRQARGLAASAPAIERPVSARRMRGTRIQATHRSNELCKPTEAHARKLAGLQARDRRLRQAAGPREVALRPADHRSTPLDHRADDLPAALEVGIPLESTNLRPRHPPSLPSGPYQALIAPSRPALMPPTCIRGQTSLRAGQKCITGELAAHPIRASGHQPAIGPRSMNRPLPRRPTNCPARMTSPARTNTSRTAPATWSPSYGV